MEGLSSMEEHWEEDAKVMKNIPLSQKIFLDNHIEIVVISKLDMQAKSLDY